ncbi:hypothetical protein [Rhodococcus pyridinivorans]
MTTPGERQKRGRRSEKRATILRNAELLPAATLLDATDRDLADKLGVSRTTLKKYFPTTGDLVAAVVAIIEDRGGTPDPELKARAKRHLVSSSQAGDLPIALLERLRQIKHLTSEEERLDALVEEASKYRGTSNRLAAAEVCAATAYQFVICPSSYRADAAEQARFYAEQGLSVIPAGHAQDELRARLYRIAAAAERRIAQAACADLTEDSTELEQSDAERVVAGRMAAIGRLKRAEAELLEGVSQSVWAAAARYHADRAVAIAEDRPELEVQATVEFATYLAARIRDQLPPPPAILVTFLIRWCAAEIAYPEQFLSQINPEDAEQLRSELLGSLGRRSRYETTSRVLATMFALAAAYSAGRPDGHHVYPHDLTAIVTYGTVGHLLVGAYLHHLAKGLNTPSTSPENSVEQNIVEPHVVEATKASGPVEELLPMSAEGLAAAARSHYRAAIARSLLGGSSKVLIGHAHRGLAEVAMIPGGQCDLEPLPLLHEVEGQEERDVDIAVIQRLALTVLIRRPPTPGEAKKLLKEFQPFIAMLRSIANHDAMVDLDDDPAESGRAEPVAGPEMEPGWTD